MHEPLKAMLWELWRTSRLELTFRLVTLIAVVLLTVLAARELDSFARQVVNAIVILLCIVGSVCSQTWMSQLDNTQTGFAFRLGFLRPVTTALLVTVPLSFVVATALASYAVPVMLYSVLTHQSLPLLGPMLIVAVISATACGVVFSSSSRLGMAIGLVGLMIGVAGLAIFLTWRQSSSEPILFRMGTDSFFAFSGPQLAGWLVTMAAVYCGTVYAVDLQRHGERILGSGRSGRKVVVQQRSSRRRPPFANAVAAQFWYEWRSFGATVLVVSLGLPAVLVGFLVAGGAIFPAVDRANAVPFWIGAIVVSPLVYQLIGANGAVGLRHVQGHTKLSTFDACRSLTNDCLIGIKLIAIASSSLLGFACMLLTAILFDLVDQQWNDWMPVVAESTNHWGNVTWKWQAAAVLNGVLAFVSSSSLLLAFGLWLPIYQCRLYIFFVGMMSHVALVIWEVQSGWPHPAAWRAYAAVWAVVVASGCGLLIFRALHSRSIRWWYLAVMGGLWLVYAASAVAVYRDLSPSVAAQIPPQFLVLGSSLLLLPLAATAVAPLALAAHRHG